jgi:CRP/FNR family transcriptional regulator, cyclic AMP receptor protein
MLVVMAVETLDTLRKVPLFSRLDRRDLERLSNSMKERTFTEGTTVTREGQGGVGFFVILSGEGAVSVGGEPRATLGPGDSFGEIALIDEGARTATITAVTDLRCLGMTAWDFKPFVQGHPDVAWSLLQGLAGRLRQAEAETG